MAKMHRSERSSGIPDEETLNEISQLVTRCNFADIISPEHRAIIIDLAIKADQAGDIADVASWYRMSKLWDGL